VKYIRNQKQTQEALKSQEDRDFQELPSLSQDQDQVRQSLETKQSKDSPPKFLKQENISGNLEEI